MTARDGPVCTLCHVVCGSAHDNIELHAFGLFVFHSAKISISVRECKKAQPQWLGEMQERNFPGYRPGFLFGCLGLGLSACGVGDPSLNP